MHGANAPRRENAMEISTALKLHPTGGFDNHAKSYKHIRVRPLAAAMGAEVQGAQIKNVDAAIFADIEDALYRHKMLYFRDQDMSLDDQERFTRRFGEFGTDAYTPGIAGHPNVQRVVKEADVRVPMIFGGSWHTDSPFLARPPAISLLFGADIPPLGGDTLWANTELAYNYLSDTMKALLAPLRVHMSAQEVIKVISALNPDRGNAPKLGSTSIKIDAEPMIAGSFHPLVRTHPKTGRKALYVDESYAVGIEGLTERESRPLLTFLREHITQPAFTCRLRWEKHTFTLWDNRSCVHHAFNDHDGYRREMYRTTVLGEVPA
jgi:taurine dioxygenase